jgi:hypothetical protein
MEEIIVFHVHPSAFMIPNAAIDSIIKDNSRENCQKKHILCQENYSFLFYLSKKKKKKKCQEKQMEGVHIYFFFFFFYMKVFISIGCQTMSLVLHRGTNIRQYSE